MFFACELVMNNLQNTIFFEKICSFHSGNKAWLTMYSFFKPQKAGWGK